MELSGGWGYWVELSGGWGYWVELSDGEVLGGVIGWVGLLSGVV